MSLWVGLVLIAGSVLGRRDDQKEVGGDNDQRELSMTLSGKNKPGNKTGHKHN